MARLSGSTGSIRPVHHVPFASHTSVHVSFQLSAACESGSLDLGIFVAEKCSLNFQTRAAGGNESLSRAMTELDRFAFVGLTEA